MGLAPFLSVDALTSQTVIAIALAIRWTSLVFVEGTAPLMKIATACVTMQKCLAATFRKLATSTRWPHKMMGLVNSSVVWPLAAWIQMRATMIQRRSTTMDIV